MKKIIHLNMLKTAVIKLSIVIICTLLTNLVSTGQQNLNAGSTELFSLDTNVFKYFPLKVGNRWTWFMSGYPGPSPHYETEKILSTRIINNHLYYFYRYDFYIPNITHYGYYRIDSLTGNLYSFDTLSQSECLLDSLNSRENDSAICCSSMWYKCDTAHFNIFNNYYKSKSFRWSSYFEGGDDHILALNIGKAQARQYGPTYLTILSLRGCLIDGILYGDTGITGINKISLGVPENFSLFQNYPNPFNPKSKIKFLIAKLSNVKLIIYDILGREVDALVNEQLKAGTYEAEWDASNYSSGVYFYKIITNDYIETRKMVLLK